ncbi:unnamed protein product [Triticum turgidum subsp. durum]|uniref:GDSL esterase/lipase n=1 Tax=Triticum turgidum subsp. durum TaxID=4567 RepID=A0A9R0WDE4_TRITD|nr:unnamed protein product [Triticum turgidum subsp. durum]
MASRFTLLACIGALFAGTAAVPPATFVFGDSLVDAGNNNYIATLSRANYAPNGIDFDGHQPTGRYTNEKTLARFQGKRWGWEGLCRPTWTQTPPATSCSEASTTRPAAAAYSTRPGASSSGGRINLDAQIDNYAKNRRDLMTQRGEVAAVSRLRGALFSVTMGSNDFINNYLVPVLSVPERAVTPPEAFINGMIAKYRQQLIVRCTFWTPGRSWW